MPTEFRREFERKFPGEMQAAKQALSELQDYFRDNGVVRPEIDELKLVMSELVYNAVIHGNKLDKTKYVSVLAGIYDGVLQAHIGDEGDGIPGGFDSVEEPPEGSEGGRGIFMVKTLCDLLLYFPDAKTVYIEKVLNAAAKDTAICVLDTRPERRADLIGFFASRGYCADAADWDGQTPLDRFDKIDGFEKTDVILIGTDPTRSGSSALTLCRRIRAGGYVGHIALYSDAFTAGLAELSLSSGADDYFPLDSTPKTLLEARVHRLARGRETERNLRTSLDQSLEEVKLIHEQLKLAKLIQRSFIKAQDFPVHAEMATRFLPAMEIGGDYFEVIKLSEDRVALILGDVSGHGISAALLTSALSMVIKKVVPQSNHPARALYHINNELCDLFEGEPGLELSYVCLFYAIIDTKKHMIYYANAGQPLPLCLRGDTVTELSVYGTPAGLLRDTVYEFRNMRCEPGDLLLLFTDGLIDNGYSRNPEIFMAKIIKLLTTVGKTAPLPELLDVLEHNFADQALTEAERFQLDDVSVVAIRL